MQIVESEIHRVEVVPPGERINYNKQNPIWTLAGAVERTELAAGRQHYLIDSLQYLLPFDDLYLAGPSGPDWAEKDPRKQENKNDFQKQNVRGYRLTGTQIIRGYAAAGDWIGPAVRLSYTPQATSPLVGAGGVLREDAIICVVRIGSSPFAEVLVPYNEESNRYEVEFWGYPGLELQPHLDDHGGAALKRGQLLVRPDLVRGTLSDFRGVDFDRRRGLANSQGSAYTLLEVAPDHAMHPIRPLHLEIAWADRAKTRWDSNNGANYHYEFNMPFRGWNAYLGGGISANPHGGVGFLEYRNLLSNYFEYEAARQAAFGAITSPELGRTINPWNVDADGVKPSSKNAERYLSVEYMDLHLLRRDCGIGIHRHRDNQEVFMLLSGKGLMIMGDWCKFPGRERCFELRTMLPGDMTICKGGRLHALLNLLDEDVTLFMFGGYD